MIQLASLLLLAFAACTTAGTPASGDDGGGSLAPGDTVRVRLEARQVGPSGPETPGPAAPEGVSARGEAGRIVVAGRMETPDPCRRLAGTAERSGSEVTLRVEARREGEACIQVIAAFAYDAEVAGLPPGTYRLRVVHAYPGTGWETQTALEETVQVR
ncbi:MAG TPA: hypothetical protein VHG51_04170 [Longimicrobiaceae bacterium]|nr:hypothetical protein [Longimicrobiaceae bacterium]